MLSVSGVLLQDMRHKTCVLTFEQNECSVVGLLLSIHLSETLVVLPSNVILQDLNILLERQRHLSSTRSLHAAIFGIKIYTIILHIHVSFASLTQDRHVKCMCKYYK